MQLQIRQLTNRKRYPSTTYLHRNCQRMAINVLVQQLCREEEVGFMDLWGWFVGSVDMYMRDGLHLSGKRAAVFAGGLSAAVDSDMMGSINIFL